MSDLHVVGKADTPTAEIYTVTPAVAKRWLSRNVRNRPIRKSLVESYARDMKSGAWQITGEAIKFDINGALSDGQHRLTAVVQSGASVDMLIVRGLAPEAQTVMDSGAKRTASDSLTFGGVKNPTVIAAAARLALKEPGAGFSTERLMAPTNTEIGRFVGDHPEIKRAAEMAGHFYPAFDAPPSVLTLCWMRFSETAGVFAAAEFFEAVANSATDGPGDPRLALIRRLSNARRNRERLESKAYLSLIIRSWNAWRQGKTVSKFQTDARGDLVKIPEQVSA